MSGTGPRSGADPARPRQVTIAGVMATVACVLLVFALFDAMSAVGSTETQKSVRDFLATGPGGTLGVGVDGVTDILRGVVLFSGALAAAGVILAVYCLRRHRGARVGLSVVAVLMLFTTTFVAGLLPFVVALAASMLWRREARDWFDGRQPQPASRPGPSSSPDGPPPSTSPWAPPEPGQGGTPGSAADPGTTGAGATGTGATGWPPPYPTGPGDRPPFGTPGFGTPGFGAPSPWAAPPTGVRRPGSVTTAVWITWVCCAVTTLLMVLLVVLLLAERDQLLTELRRNPSIADTGYSSDQLVASLWVVAAVGIFWSLAASALAALAFQGFRSGQVGVLVSAVMAGLIGIATLVVPVLALATVVLLLLSPSNRWFATRRTGGSPGGSPPGGFGGPGGSGGFGSPSGFAGPGGSSGSGSDDSGRPPVW
jgi:hypothetical protein